MGILEVRQLLPTMHIKLDFAEQSISNIELYDDYVKLLTYNNQQHSHHVYCLPKDSLVKVLKNPYAKEFKQKEIPFHYRTE